MTSGGAVTGPDPWFPPPVTCPPQPRALSRREAQVLYGICRGHSNAEIARRLGLTEDTVKTHAQRLYRALGARDRAHAVALAHACPPTIVKQRPAAKVRS